MLKHTEVHVILGICSARMMQTTLSIKNLKKGYSECFPALLQVILYMAKGF